MVLVTVLEQQMNWKAIPGQTYKVPLGRRTTLTFLIDTPDGKTFIIQPRFDRGNLSEEASRLKAVLGEPSGSFFNRLHRNFYRKQREELHRSSADPFIRAAKTLYLFSFVELERAVERVIPEKRNLKKILTRLFDLYEDERNRIGSTPQSRAEIWQRAQRSTK